MSEKIATGSRVSFEPRGRYAGTTHTGTLDRYEPTKFGEWAIVKLDGGAEKKTRPSTLRLA